MVRSSSQSLQLAEGLTRYSRDRSLQRPSKKIWDGALLFPQNICDYRTLQGLKKSMDRKLYRVLYRQNTFTRSSTNLFKVFCRPKIFEKSSIDQSPLQSLLYINDLHKVVQ